MGMCINRLAGLAVIKTRFVTMIGLMCAVFISTVNAQIQAKEIARYESEFSRAYVAAVVVDGKAGLAVVFEGTDDLHFYANPKTVPAPGFELKVSARAEGITFGEPVFSKWEMFDDPAVGKIEVFVGDFTVFIPFVDAKDTGVVIAEVKIAGLACTSRLCLAPFEHVLKAEFDLSRKASWPATSSEPEEQQAKVVEDVVESAKPSVLPFSAPVYLILAVLAGISINIMPCVLPVIPLILMRLIKNAKESSCFVFFYNSTLLPYRPLTYACPLPSPFLILNSQFLSGGVPIISISSCLSNMPLILTGSLPGSKTIVTGTLPASP